MLKMKSKGYDLSVSTGCPSVIYVSQYKEGEDTVQVKRFICDDRFCFIHIYNNFKNSGHRGLGLREKLECLNVDSRACIATYGEFGIYQVKEMYGSQLYVNLNNRECTCDN